MRNIDFERIIPIAFMVIGVALVVATVVVGTTTNDFNVVSWVSNVANPASPLSVF